MALVVDAKICGIVCLSKQFPFTNYMILDYVINAVVVIAGEIHFVDCFILKFLRKICVLFCRYRHGSQVIKRNK